MGLMGRLMNVLRTPPARPPETRAVPLGQFRQHQQQTSQSIKRLKSQFASVVAENGLLRKNVNELAVDLKEEAHQRAQLTARIEAHMEEVNRRFENVAQIRPDQAAIKAAERQASVLNVLQGSTEAVWKRGKLMPRLASLA